MDHTSPRVVLVSGASGGMGSAVSGDLAADSTVVMLGRSLPRLQRARDRIAEIPSERLVTLEMDINNSKSVNDGVKRIADTHGRIDGLVHCAGDGPLGALHQTDDEMWQNALNAKLLGAVRLCRAASPFMTGGTSAIVLVSGTFRKQPDPDFPVNSTVNAALAAFGKAISRDLGRRGIRVNVIDPGVTDTGLWSDTAREIAEQRGGTPQDVNADILALTPLGRMTTPHDIAQATRFLLSPAAANMTGAALSLDGGASAAL